MTLEERLKRVLVVGAGGKMGSGIALLMLQEMALTEAKMQGTIGSGAYRLYLVDANPDALIPLKKYLRNQLRRFAEKNIVALREAFQNNENLVSNEEIIDAFIEGALDLTFFSTDVSQAKDAQLVFEAVVEDIDAKATLFKRLNQICSSSTFFLSNTSSIPIALLSDKSGIQGRLIGYHFYNPPPVQKLLELIVPEEISPDLEEISIALAKGLRKHIVRSNDVAGFIGNGHFVREGIYACARAAEVGIERLNHITQELLIRPMGIFQLIDYVGIDIFYRVMGIMREYLEDSSIQSTLIERMVAKNVLGGQYPDGSQKNGFFQYEKGKITALYDCDAGKYVPLKKPPLPLPEKHVGWKQVQRMPDKDAHLKEYFRELFHASTEEAKIALDFLRRSQAIAEGLVLTGVAEELHAVDEVLCLGFYHAYGVSSPWLLELETSIVGGK